MTIYRGVSLLTLPRRHYRTIYCDPPWGFLSYSKTLVIPQRAEKQHYDSMSIERLKALPVPLVAAKNCVLHMWVISSHVEIAIDIAEAWGFSLKSLGLVWVKTQKGNPLKPKMGMGHWFRQEAEVALVFTRGKPSRVSKGVRQVILEPAREHSRKPDAGIERVEMLSEGPYLEMFSRSDREGWDSWGAEAGKFVDPLMRLEQPVEPLQALLRTFGLELS